MSYLFESNRLGFRNWSDDDVQSLHEVSSDPEVMEYFPAIKTYQETKAFVKKMQIQFNEKGYCYFPAVLKSTKEVMGFIGISYQTYNAPFNPSIDIGWRLGKKYWAKGYATEGAKTCLEYGFKNLNIEEIVSIAALANTPSIKVMKKIGMHHVNDFDHPLLLNYNSIKKCSLYKITTTQFNSIV